MNMNRISFKSVIFDPSFNNLSEKVKQKTEPAQNLANSYVNNNVIFGSDNKGNLTVEVVKANLLYHLYDPLIFNLHPDIETHVNIANGIKTTYDTVHEISQDSLKDVIKNPSKKSPAQIEEHVKAQIDAFNEVYVYEDNLN